MKHSAVGWVMCLAMLALAACTDLLSEPAAPTQAAPAYRSTSEPLATATQPAWPTPIAALPSTAAPPETSAPATRSPFPAPPTPAGGTVAQIGGLIRGLASEPPFLYLTNGPSLTILDASDPTHPQQVGQMALADATFEDVAVAGGLAYLVGPSGLWIVDVSNPKAPLLVSHSRQPSRSKAVVIQKALAYVAGNDSDENRPGQSGLFILDVADPEAPALLGALAAPEDAYALAVQDGLAYLGVSGSMVVVDVSDPAAPRSVGSYQPDLGGIPAIAVAGDTGYLTSFDDFSVLDLANPAAPQRLGSVPINGFDIEVAGDMALVTTGGLTVVDVSNPISPTGIGWHWEPARVEDVADVALAGNLTYLVVGQSDVHVVDVSNPRQPTLVGGWEIVPGAPSREDPSIMVPAGTPGFISAVALANDHLFAAEADRGLWAFDLTDPAAPRPVNFKEMPGDFMQLTALGNFLIYVAKGGLWFVDVSSPTALRIESSCCPEGATWLDVQDGIGYMATGSNGLRVLDMADAAHPVEIGVFPSDARQIKVVVRGSIAYVAEAPERDPESKFNWLGGGLRILDVSNPAQPQEIAFIDTPGWVEDMAVVGDRVYLAEGGSGGVRVFDVSNPAAPVEVQVHEAHTWPRHVIIVDGDQAIVPIAGVLYTFDLPAPGVAPGLDVLAQAGLGVVAGDLVYVPANDQGLVVLRLPETTQP